MTRETDTPRTDEQIWHAEYHHENEDVVDADFAKQLERELNESEAEVERLKEELAVWDYGTRAKREQDRAEKAESEVERLSKLTADCLDVIRVYCPRFYQDAMDRFNTTKK